MSSNAGRRESQNANVEIEIYLGKAIISILPYMWKCGMGGKYEKPESQIYLGKAIRTTDSASTPLSILT